MNYKDTMSSINCILNKFELVLLLLIIISLPLNCIPIKWRLPVLGSTLYYYPLLILVCVFFLFDKQYIAANNINLKKYLIFGLVWNFITLLLGLYIYPYYSQLGEPQGKAIEMVINSFHFLDWNSNAGIILVVFLKTIKDLLLLFMSGPVIMFITYQLFTRLDLNNRFNIYSQMVFFFSSIIIVFAIPEILLYKFNIGAALDIMIDVTSFIQETTEKYLGWYPPLVWHNEQLRSICTEPAMLGTFFGFTIPFVLKRLLINNNYAIYLYYFLFIVLTVMSKSRTSVVILGLHFVTIFLAFIIYKSYRKKLVACIMIFCIGVMFGIIDFRNNMSDTLEAYVVNNIDTVIDSKARSNKSRLINIEKTVSVGVDHFITGVGIGLKDYYIFEKLNTDDLVDTEINKIHDGIANGGSFTYGFGNVNQYAVWFVSEGIVGLVYYVLPPFYLLYLVVRKNLYKKLDYYVIISSIISFLACMMVGAVSPALYITLGVVFSMLYIDRDKKLIQ